VGTIPGRVLMKRSPVHDTSVLRACSLKLGKELRSIFRRLRYGNAVAYRNELRMRQAGDRAAAREAWQHQGLNSPLRRVPATAQGIPRPTDCPKPER